MSDLEARSPDGKWMAMPGPRNTIIIKEAETDRYWGTYYGHWEGVYRLGGDAAVDRWTGNDTLITRSSNGSGHEWRASSCTHLRSLREADAIAYRP